MKTHDLSKVCLQFQDDDYTPLSEDFVASEITCQENDSSEEWTDVRTYVLLLCKQHYLNKSRISFVVILPKTTVVVSLSQTAFKKF